MANASVGFRFPTGVVLAQAELPDANQRTEATQLIQQGEAALANLELTAALTAFQAAFAIYQSLELKQEAAIIQEKIGNIYLKLQEFDLAALAFQSANNIRENHESFSSISLQGLQQQLVTQPVAIRTVSLSHPAFLLYHFEPAETCLPQTEVSEPSWLVSLLPREERWSTAILPTIASHPSFFWHLPQSNAQRVRFELIEIRESSEENFDSMSDRNSRYYEKVKTIYQAEFNPDRVSGIMQLTLPSDTPELEIGKSYFWSVELVFKCSLSQWATGAIHRVPVSASLAQAISKASIIEYPALYAQYGLWYDVIHNLWLLRTDQPNNPVVVQAWQDILKSMQLEELSNQPLIYSIPIGP